MKILDEIGNVQFMQKINRLKVLECIRYNGPLARPEIARVTGLSPSSITNIVSYLLERNLVAETGTVDSGEVGRKATLIRFKPSAYNIISVNIETSKVNLALTDLSGEILTMKEIPIERLMKDYEILNMIKKEIGQFISHKDEQSDLKIAGIGVAVSGLVQDEGRWVISSSLRWKGISLKEQFENIFHLPVYIQNNSRTKALWALRKHVDEQERNVVFLDLTMGVGIISFFDHRINEAVIGEFGHTTVKKDGPLCFCGNRGCLELMCSVDMVVNTCSELLGQGRCRKLEQILKEEGGNISYTLILQAFDKGDEDVREVLRECGEYLGIGIANLINIFNPQRMIINGDILLKSDFVYETAVSEAGKRAYEQFANDLIYQKVDIGVKESVQGVSLYVADKLFELSGPIL
jgi:predicted NBD/HSP70 family sugar kinase